MIEKNRKAFLLLCFLWMILLAGCLGKSDGKKMAPSSKKALEEIAEPIVDWREEEGAVSAVESIGQTEGKKEQELPEEPETEKSGEAEEAGENTKTDRETASLEDREIVRDTTGFGEDGVMEEETFLSAKETEESRETGESEEPEETDEQIDRINRMALKPSMPKSENLKEILNMIMPEIIADCATTYDQIRACYDYLINFCEYSPTVKYSYEQDAYLLLTERHGSCTYYAAALHYMLLYIGVDNRIIDGYRYLTPELDRTSFHRWNEITVDGVAYILDSQWEDTLAFDGEILYERFLKTHEEMAEYYVF